MADTGRDVLAALRVPLLLDGWWVGSRGEEVGAGVAVYPGGKVSAQEERVKKRLDASAEKEVAQGWG